MINELGLIALPLSIIVLLCFGGIALYYSKQVKKLSDHDTEFFLTARNSQSTAVIAWSFYSSTVGAWVLFVPGGYVVHETLGAGWLGLICYAVFSGSPILLVAWLGSILRNRYPGAISIGDFARWRYGRVMEAYVTFLVIFFVGLALSVEYTTIGGLFSEFYGVSRAIPILVVFVITMTYTSIGGVYVSIVTDQWQARFSLLLSLIAIIYIAVTFRPSSLPPLPANLGLNEAGIGSLITLGISFPATGIFNDAYWQRVWSSEDEKSLKKGATIAFILVTLVVFTFGFGAFLASWAGYVTNPDNAFFAILSTGGKYSPAWIMILVTLLAVAMNESLVDSYQNALTDCAVSLALSCGMDISITSARVITFLMNLPVVLIGLQGYNVNSLFLVACLATTTSCSPLIFGLCPAFDKYIRQGTALFGCVFSVLSIMLYGYIEQKSIVKGIYYCFWQSYQWPVFLIAVAGCLVGMALYAGCEMLYCWKKGIAMSPFTPNIKPVHVDREDPDEIAYETFSFSEARQSRLSVQSLRTALSTGSIKKPSGIVTTV